MEIETGVYCLSKRQSLQLFSCCFTVFVEHSRVRLHALKKSAQEISHGTLREKAPFGPVRLAHVRLKAPLIFERF